MNLSRLYSIFGKRGRIDRRDIEEYAQSSDADLRNAIEQKAAADNFNSDAMEGWEQLNYNTSVLSSLDKKFLPKSYTTWYILGGTILIASIVISIVLFNTTKQDSTNLQAANVPNEIVPDSSINQQIALDQSDILMPVPIEEMNNAPKQKQVLVTTIKRNFQEIDAIRIEETPLTVAILPILDIDIKKTEDQEIIRAHEFAKEIYLHDLKLVDYSNYRSEPQVKTRQMILTGTPANKEDANSEEFDPVWKDVDVPYIEFIDKTIRIFGQGNYKKALARFETVLETYELDVNAQFYSGLCLYNLGEYRSAIDHFDSCMNGPYSNFDEESLWMKALSLEHLGEKNAAKKLFQQIRDSKGYYATQARSRLK